MVLVASPLLILAEALGTRLDSDLLPRMYAIAGLPTAQIRNELRAAGLGFVDPATDQIVDPLVIARTAQIVAKSSARRAAIVGVAGGVAGLASIPPELAVTLVLSLRLGQRLAVVHGFDPETDAGKLMLARALAAAHGVQIPEFGRVATRVSDLPIVVRAQLPGAAAAFAWLGKQVVWRSSNSLAGRAIRVVPGLAASISGFGAWRRHDELARAMCDVYSRAMEADSFALDDVVPADEIRG